MECKSNFVLNLFNIKAGKIVLPTLSDLRKPPQPPLKVAERSCCVLMRQGFDSRPQFGVRTKNIFHKISNKKRVKVYSYI